MWFEEDKLNGVATEVEVPLGERISRYFKDLFSKDDMRESKDIQDIEYDSYLNLYRKA